MREDLVLGKTTAVVLVYRSASFWVDKSELQKIFRPNISGFSSFANPFGPNLIQEYKLMVNFTGLKALVFVLLRWGTTGSARLVVQLI